MIGAKLGHYRLTAKIGEGGMGVVYRARDEELNRDVAVKVLAAGMLEQLGKDHLLREAQTASALSHPNICTIYQVGRVDDGFYFVMELVEGQPLSELARTTKLTTEAVTRYGVQIADAVQTAHASGIVHGGLRPNSILVTLQGQVKVLDFGMAKMTEGALTVEGSIVGTSYRSPEQAPVNAPYVTTPDRIVNAMLKLAGVKKADTVYDLGCGDGRIVISAARQYGAHGVGIETPDARHLWEADTNMGAFFKRDMITGAVVDSIELPEGSPFPHGMSVWKGYIYWTDDIGGGIAPVCRVKI